MNPKGPGRASKGSGEAFRFIWTKFQPKWAHPGPIRAPFSSLISQKPILGPNSSKSIIPNEVLGPWALWALDPEWTWSYLGLKWVLGKFENEKEPHWAEDGSIWAET